jgi:hypothetical protein
MKIKKTFSLILITVVLSSCAPTASFYQVYKTIPSENMQIKDNYLVYEDNNCIVSYNLWGAGGNMSFRIYNKTNLNIFLNLEESFFIHNGIANDYYKNRVFTHSKSSGNTASRGALASNSETGTNIFGFPQSNQISASASVGVISSSQSSVSVTEAKRVVIPPKTSRIFTEYSINETLIRNCELFKYPTNRQIITKRYRNTDSPLVFSNRISYTIGDTDNLIRFENEFYVSEVTNYPEREMIEGSFLEFCGQKSTIQRSYNFKNASPDKFYIKYSKGQDNWKH